MRISSGTFYDSGMGSMQQQSERLMQVQQQIASGRRILTPADDPVAAARALDVTQAQSINNQYGVNGGRATDSLSMEESVLGSVTSLLQNVRDQVVYAGNGSLTASDRASLATDVRGRLQELLGLANSTDGTGQYLFSGYQGGIRPFSELAPGTFGYNGDQGQRLIQVGASRQIAVSDSGIDVFQRIPSGEGDFATQAGINTGTAVIDAGMVSDTAKWNGAGNHKDFTVKFAVNAGVTTYDIIDNIAGTSLLLAPRAYVSGANIDLSQVGPPAFDFGAQVIVSGTPANGDSFSIKASQDVFKTLDVLVNLLASPANGTTLANRLAGLLGTLDNALANVSTVRASTGGRLRELDSLKTSGDDLNLQYSQTLSRLQDLDYAKATSELMQEQVNLQAAQQSFAKVAGLSLFNYL